MYSAVSDDTGTISTFTSYDLYRIYHSGAISNYQKLLEIDWDVHMQAAFQDIRFVTLAGNHIPYWIESKVDSTSANVWIKYNQLDGDTYIKMYYGNSGLSSGSSIFNTGEIGSDDFSTYDTGIWTSNGSPTSDGDILSVPSGVTLTSLGDNPTDCIIEWNAKYQSGSYASVGLGLASNVDYFAVFYSNYPTGSSHSAVNRINSNPTQTVTNIGSQTDAYHKYKITRIGTTSIKYQIDDGAINTHNTNLLTGNLEARVFAQTQIVLIDTVLIRKYVAIEPTYTVTKNHQEESIPVMY